MVIDKVVIENSDCKIWHLDRVILDLVQALMNADKVIVSLNQEGPCAHSLGLYSLLDNICDRFAIEKHKVIVQTCNLIEAHPQYQVQHVPPFKGIAALQKKLADMPLGHKTITESTKHFGSFVGHGNRMRLALSSYLYHNHRNKTLQSFHTDVTNPYFNQFVGLEELMFHNYDPAQVSMAWDFLKCCPIKLDNIVSYPILHEEKVYDLLDHYPGIFVDIVNQTYTSGHTFYLDDKFWRSVITRTPFIVQGPSNFLSNLKKLGFQTFDRWWDEGYSEDPPDYQVKGIIDVIDYLSLNTAGQLAKMYDDMKPILDHNYDFFMSLDSSGFAKVSSGV